MFERYDRLHDVVIHLLYEAKAKAGTWEETADAIGISTKALWRYKSGQCLPSLDTYEMLCEFVGRHCYP